MAVRTSAANQALTGTGPTGAVATVLGWVYIVNDRNAFSNAWIMHNGVEGSPEAAFGTDSDGTTFFAYDSTFTTLGSFASTPGTWYRHATVMNSTSWTVYFGAAGAALSSASGTMTAISSPSTFGLSSTGDWIDARQASVRVYTAALSVDEIENELAQYKPVRTANLQRQHPFINAELIDYSGAGLSLTAGAGATTTEAGPPIRWDGRLVKQLRVPAASNVANPNAGSASIGLSAQNATVTREGRPTPTAATIGMAAQNATVTTTVNVAAGYANIILAEDNPTTRINPTAQAATFTLAGQTAAASTAITNASAATASVGLAAGQATTTIAPRVGVATFSLAAQAATVLGGTNTSPTAASVALTARTPSPSIRVNAGLATIGVSAGDVISGNLGLACANLTTVVTVDQHFGVVSVGDQHSATVEVEAHSSTVGVEEHYAVAGVCGRS